jgi:hypothetical protein
MHYDFIVSVKVLQSPTRLSSSSLVRRVFFSLNYLRLKEEMMRTLIISKPGPVSPPPEMVLPIMEAFREWRSRGRSKMEAFEFFAGTGGGWGVFNTADEKELSQAMIEYPWAPFSVTEALPTVDGDEAMERFIATLKQMMSAAQPPQ